MGFRLSKIYTRTGDDGTTNIGGQQRVRKDHVLIEVFGDVDELNSAIGVVLAHQNLPDAINEMLITIQHDLFNLGGELVYPENQMISKKQIDQLEQKLDELNESLPALKEFILPGGCEAAAQCHLARAICRRAERHLVRLSDDIAFNPYLLHYLNRLSDYLFVAARSINQANQCAEILWQRE